MNKKIIGLTLAFCSACSIGPEVIKESKDSAPRHVPINVMAVPDAVPRYEKRTRAGNPGVYRVLGKQYRVMADSRGYRKTGMASWYGNKFHGRKTSNGETYDMYAMTAAHKTLPIPCYVRVTNLKNQRSVVVRINDRGPFHGNRLIDLSYTAAVKLGIQQTGTGLVEVIALQPETKKAVSKNNIQPLQQQDKGLYLQVGAFSNEFNAKQLQSELFSKQITQARVRQTKSQTGEMYRVQVGPFDTVDQADEVNKKLSLMGLQNTRIVTELK